MIYIYTQERWDDLPVPGKVHIRASDVHQVHLSGQKRHLFAPFEFLCGKQSYSRDLGLPLVPELDHGTICARCADQYALQRSTGTVPANIPTAFKAEKKPRAKADVEKVRAQEKMRKTPPTRLSIDAQQKILKDMSKKVKK